MATGRFTQPSEVAGMVLFLASDLTANVTGADFAIDGGLILDLVKPAPGMDTAGARFALTGKHRHEQQWPPRDGG